MKKFINFKQERMNMVEKQLRRRGIFDERILNTMNTVPRHKFVDQAEQNMAYADCPLPIGHGQTISQPYIVAFMTERLELNPKHKVLEIGTGCGYQSAVLSLLVKTVISLEYIESLAISAEKRLKELNYNNVSIHNTNGLSGWEKEAPYDRIIGTAAPQTIPEKLIDQLAPNGIMVLPIGKNIFDQYLQIVKKDEHGYLLFERSLGVRFVPMVK